MQHLTARALDPSATTRTARSTRVARSGQARSTRVARSGQSRVPLLAHAQVITSPETKLRYEIGKQIGQGGFGQVYLATRLGRSDDVPANVCVKISDHQDTWL